MLSFVFVCFCLTYQCFFYIFFRLYNNQGEVALAHKERLLSEGEDDYYYVPTRVRDVNLSMQ